MAVGLMEVLLVNARGLGDTDIIGRMDPYVVVKYKSQEHRTSVARGQGGNPVWNERLIFRVEYPGSGEQYKLTFKIMDKDTFTRDDTVGEATIYVKELLELGVEKGFAEINPKKYSVVAADKSFRGEIQVGVVFTKKAEPEFGGQAFGGWKHSESYS
ncbi:16 kDa phloem protein 1 isoform X2 [Argentina anserina]|uniref:16 kDa phloem protein 1 isoform X2 n=1 Tax=Argentina anserina TaxID=57926 RepID=UPI00217635AF|nr:16 kDa phloem protein 1 isoform X2 [Potentilla anserina]